MTAVVRVLSVHAEYGCRHRGRCCTSGWPIDLNPTEHLQLQNAINAGVLVPHNTTKAQPALVPTGHGALLATAHGACVFHDAQADGGCRIHRVMSHAALPMACRQFPRQSVTDPRGVSVTLSHYCPTAADLLYTHQGAIGISDSASRFPADAEYVGLVADNTLPPLVHARLVMDWDSWWACEALAVALFDDADSPLSRMALAVEHIRTWTVDQGPLLAHIHQSFARARAASVTDAPHDTETMEARYRDAHAAVPAAWQQAAEDALSVTSGAIVPDQVWRRFVAAHVFGNWTAYLGEGLRTWFRAVETASCLLQRTGDPGRVDLVLRHLADSSALVARWNPAEQVSLIPRP